MAKKLSFKLHIMDYEQEFEKDLETDNGFIITEKLGLIDKDRVPGGIYSPQYGTMWGDDDSYADRYKCDCGYLRGRIFESSVCDKCNTEVKFKDNNINMTGWFILNEFHLIHPNLYKFLESLMGKDVLDDIISPSVKRDRRGKIVKINDKTFSNIGMIEFYERFDEILEYFYKKKKATKKAEYEFLVEHREKIFITKYPVFSLLLRPIQVTDQDMNYHDINNAYQILATKMFLLNRREYLSDKKIDKIAGRLYSAQKKINSITDIIVETMITKKTKKEGHIRNNILGSRNNYSSRMVIVPICGKGEDYRIDGVDLPYTAALELFRPEIINLLMKLENISVSRATEQWKKAFIIFNKKIHQIMTHYIKKAPMKATVPINRNPTLAYGGILSMRVACIKTDIDDTTMAIPISVLSVMGADFDGDVLGAYAPKVVKVKRVIDSVFNPRLNLVISPNDGEFNNDFNLLKDQTIGLHQFCMLSRINKPMRYLNMRRVV